MVCLPGYASPGSDCCWQPSVRQPTLHVLCFESQVVSLVATTHLLTVVRPLVGRCFSLPAPRGSSIRQSSPAVSSCFPPCTDCIAVDQLASLIRYHREVLRTVEISVTLDGRMVFINRRQQPPMFGCACVGLGRERFGHSGGWTFLRHATGA